MTSLLTADMRRYWRDGDSVFRGDSGTHKRRVAFIAWNGSSLQWEVTPERITDPAFKVGTLHDAFRTLADLDSVVV